MLVELEALAKVERNVEENEHEWEDETCLQIVRLALKGSVIGGRVELRSDEER